MHIIDTHNHSLPGIDDGAKDIDMAIEMLKIAATSGTKEVVLTPHHLNGAFNNFADKIQQQTNLLRSLVIEHQIDIKLHTGSEIHLVPETTEHLIEKKALSYCGLGKAALIELPKHTIPHGAERILSELVYAGITPIIAHPERNSGLRADFGPLKEWIAFGCKSQITGQSCSGSFGNNIQTISLNMISQGLVHIVASDAHRPSGRSPSLSNTAKALNQFYGKDVSEILLATNPKRLIEGKDLIDVKISTPIREKKRSWFNRTKKSKK